MAGTSDRGSAVLTARRYAGAGRTLVSLTPPEELARQYLAPGQYVEVFGDSPGYFVLGGDVGAPSWELLVRNTGGASELLTTAPEGAMFEVSAPLGSGFPVERARGRPLILAVVGTALSAARPILRERIGRPGHETHVYVGVRSAREVSLAEEVAGWVDGGASLVLCLSRPDLDGPLLFPAARRAPGWVQHVLASDIHAGRVANALVFAAGPQPMLDTTLALAGGPSNLEVIANV